MGRGGDSGFEDRQTEERLTYKNSSFASVISSPQSHLRISDVGQSCRNRDLEMHILRERQKTVVKVSEVLHSISSIHPPTLSYYIWNTEVGWVTSGAHVVGERLRHQQNGHVL